MSESTLIIPGLNDESIVSIRNVRTYEQYLDMVKCVLSGVCPFCQLDPDLNKVIKQFGHWRIWENPFPHKRTRGHYMIAPVSHATHFHDLSSDEWDGYDACVDYVTNAEIGIGIEGGIIATRFGPGRLNAGTIRHLHANVMWPDETGSLKVTVVHSPEENANKLQILEVFEKMRSGIPYDSLSEFEKKLVEGRI